MFKLINGDCLKEMKTIEDKSIDLIFCDLPYGQTSCKWDCCIDLDVFWKEVMRIKKLNTPIIMTTTTKFGVSLIQSAPKKCPFRYDLIWCKSAPCGFLSAKKMPMRKHEMIYVFYEKLPFYDLSSHTHKFIATKPRKKDNIYGMKAHADGKEGKYDPPLPNSVLNLDEGNNVKPNELGITCNKNKTLYGRDENGCTMGKEWVEKKGGRKEYEPPLPTSLIDEGNNIKPDKILDSKNYATADRKSPLKQMGTQTGNKGYDPPLPTSLIEHYGVERVIYVDENGNKIKEGQSGKDQNHYEPPLPHSLLQIKSTKGKHSTEKPVALMEWVFKYYSKEGDTILDPTMGSGSTGVACKNMNRNFIGIEMDDTIFKVAEDRLK